MAIILAFSRAYYISITCDVNSSRKSILGKSYSNKVLIKEFTQIYSQYFRWSLGKLSLDRPTDINRTLELPIYHCISLADRSTLHRSSYGFIDFTSTAAMSTMALRFDYKSSITKQHNIAFDPVATGRVEMAPPLQTHASAPVGSLFSPFFLPPILGMELEKWGHMGKM